MGAEATRTTGTYIRHRPTFEPKPDPSRTLSLAGMTRRECHSCGPESLFCRSFCVNCGYDFTPRKKRSKRAQWNGAGRAHARGIQRLGPVEPPLNYRRNP